MERDGVTTFYSQNIWNSSPAGYRNKLLRSLIDDFDADICAFQECGPETNRKGLPSVHSVMSDFYAEVLPQLSNVNFTPLFYKKDKYNVVDCGYQLYTGLNDANSKGVSWAVFEDKETQKRFAFASTHFWWKARGEEDTNQRMNNARELKVICSEIINKYNVSVIIGGDFNNGKNSLQGTDPYFEMLKMGFVDIRTIAEDCTKQEYTCQNAYPVLQDDESFTKCPMEPNICIDYIFIYGEFTGKIKKFHIETNDKARTISDHTPLIAEIEL